MGDIIRRPSQELDMVPQFFTFHQNNSGGWFSYIPDKGIGEYVVVQALSVDDANHRAENIGLYFDGSGDCRCCGDRWSELWGAYDRGSSTPQYHGTPMEDFGLKSFKASKYYAFIHYLDGTIEGLRSKNYRASDEDVLDTQEVAELE